MGFSWILKQPAACVWGDEKAGLTFQQQLKEIMPLSICFALSVAMGNLLLGKKLTNVTTWSRPDWDSRSSQSSATIFAIFIWHGSEVFKSTSTHPSIRCLDPSSAFHGLWRSSMEKTPLLMESLVIIWCSYLILTALWCCNFFYSIFSGNMYIYTHTCRTHVYTLWQLHIAMENYHFGMFYLFWMF